MRGNEELIGNFYHRVKSAVDKGWPLDPNGNQTERIDQKDQRKAKYIEFTVKRLRPNGLRRKVHQYLIEQPNATWDAFQAHMKSKDVIYTVSSELVPNATTDQNTKLHSLEHKIKELTALFKEQQVNQLNQSSPRPAKADNKSRQRITRFCSYCRRKGHTLMYCRTEAHDEKIKKQQTRNNQGRRTVFTHDYNRRRGPKSGSQKTQTFNQQPRYGNQNNQTSYRQTGFNPGRTGIQTQIDSITKADQATPGTTDQMTDSKLNITSTLDQKINTIKTFHRAKFYLHPTQFNLLISHKM